MLKGIIFDMDGLMVDTEPMSFVCYKEIIESYGYTFHLDEYVKTYPGKSLLTSFNYMKEHYHIDFDIEEKIELFKALEIKYMKENGIELKKGLVDLLKYLKEHHYKTIIATSSIEERAYRILERHDILKYFDTVVYGSEVSRGKPFPDIFLKACEKLDIKPDEALVLEDSEAGIQAAYDANIPVICIPDMKFPQELYVIKTTAILSSLDQVIDYIEKKS